jgi:hypothetical protein
VNRRPGKRLRHGTVLFGVQGKVLKGRIVDARNLSLGFQSGLVADWPSSKRDLKE